MEFVSFPLFCPAFRIGDGAGLANATVHRALNADPQWPPQSLFPGYRPRETTTTYTHLGRIGGQFLDTIHSSTFRPAILVRPPSLGFLQVGMAGRVRGRRRSPWATNGRRRECLPLFLSPSLPMSPSLPRFPYFSNHHAEFGIEAPLALRMTCSKIGAYVIVVRVWFDLPRPRLSMHKSRALCVSGRP